MTTGTMWRPWGQHGVETMETTAMETTWGPSGGYGDNVGTTGMTRGQCVDDMGTTGTTGGPWGQHGVETTEETTAMETTWGPSGGDDMGMTMGTTWGPWG